MNRTDKGEALAQEAGIMRKLGQQLAALEDMGLKELREQHLSLYGEEARSKNLPYLRKRLAFRLQERVEGGLSPQAQTRLEELMPEELPIRPKSKQSKSVPTPRKVDVQPKDSRLPEQGTILTREHKGFVHEVEILEQGFRYRGRPFTSLSTIAKEITGTAWNGFTFFGLKKAQVHAEG